jgi:hypothetical protein
MLNFLYEKKIFDIFINRIILFFTLCVMSVLYISCTKKTHYTSSYKFIPKIKVVVNLKFYYLISTETNIKFEISDKNIENLRKTKIGLLYEILKDSANRNIIKLTFESLNIFTKNGDTEKEMSAENASEFSDPVEKILGLVKGCSITEIVSNKGQIVSVSGYKELTDKIINSVTFRTEQEKKQAIAQLSYLIGDKFIQNNFQETLSCFPDSGVYVGDHWTKTETNMTEFKMNSNTTYTLESVKDSVAEIDASTEMKSTDSSFEIMGTDVNADLKGEQDGTFNIDLRTGLLIYQKTSASIKGNITLVDREVPITIKIKKEISSRKL